MTKPILTINKHPHHISLSYPYHQGLNNWLYENQYYAMWNAVRKCREIATNTQDDHVLREKMKTLIHAWMNTFSITGDAAFRQWLTPPMVAPVVPGLFPVPVGLSLLPYQKEGIQFLLKQDGIAFCGDEMGLGKTCQAIFYLAMAGHFPALIICPATLKLNWRNEVTKWLLHPKTIQVVTSGDKLTGADITIINYDIVGKYFTALASAKYQVMILDECHAVKNPKSKRSNYVYSLAKNIPHRIGLSGTPFINRPVELFTPIKIIKPTLFPNYWKYVRRYCNATKNSWGGLDVGGASNLDELNRILSTIMIRRKKADVLKDLPAKRRIIIPLEHSGPDTTDQINKIFLKIRQQKTKKIQGMKDQGISMGILLGEIEKIRQDVVKTKLPQCIEFISGLIEEKKVVVFAHHRFVIDALRQAFPQSVAIVGEMSAPQRQQAVEAFQNDPSIRLFVGSLHAASEGITLAAADTVVFCEFDWTPAIHQQAEDRCHRIGQKESVIIYYLALDRSLDIHIAKKLQAKQEILDQTLDAQQDTNLFSEMVHAGIS